MTKQQFETLMQMHRDTIQEVQEVRKELKGHIEDDAKVHKVVDRHSTYWRGAATAISAMFAGALAWAGWK